MARRSFLRQMFALPFVGVASSWGQSSGHKQLNIMMKSAWGSDDPTKAAFPFLHGLALSEAGHTVQIFLLGEAVSLMRSSVAAAVVPVGWPPLEGTLKKVADRKVQIYACGACCRARSGCADGSGSMGSQVRQPHDLCLAGRVGGPRNHRVGGMRVAGQTFKVRPLCVAVISAAAPFLSL